MALALHQLKPSPYSKRKKKRLGRGDSSGHGSYSGRGIKGQRSRSGGKKGLKKKALRRLIKKIPQKRGFVRPQKIIFEIVNLKDLESKFKSGEKITPQLLKEKGLIKKEKFVKILGEGKLTKKLEVEAHAFSKKAKEAILKCGGKIKNL